MPQPDLRVALVTGAARGIGAATVHPLFDNGHAVIAVDGCSRSSAPQGVTYPLQSHADLDRVALAAPERVLALQCDVRDRRGINHAVEQGVSRRLLTPEEITGTIAFCCSPAGGALNGSVIHADGGFVG